MDLVPTNESASAVASCVNAPPAGVDGFHEGIAKKARTDGEEMGGDSALPC